MTEHSLSKTLGDYIIKRTIGEGTFSKVKLGINKITNEKVAIKILEKSKIVEKDDLDRILREMKIITELNHQNVIKVHEMCESNEYFLIIMEYCEGGELFNYIVENQRLSEEETAYFFYQLINGIEYIHSKGIVHRDLKPENLLLDENKVLKIIDFGLSNFYNGTYLSTPCGSPCYASPEMVSGKSYNGFYIDVWSTGIILFAMMCGYLPFEDPDNDILFKKILAGRLHYPSHLSPLAKDIMKRIFEFTDRIADKLFKSPKLNSLFKKIVSREMFDYLLFGVLTTVVNFICFHLCEKLFGTELALVSDIIAWIVSVLFAFVTNKFIVFRSNSTDSKTLTKELVSFTGARLLSLGIEELGLIIAQFVFNADKKVLMLTGAR